VDEQKETRVRGWGRLVEREKLQKKYDTLPFIFLQNLKQLLN
jgi:hypothetical protein